MRVKSKMQPGAVKKAVDRAAPKTLKGAGALVWTIARRSLRSRKNRNLHSAPGTAPYDHGGGAGVNTSLKRSIMFAVESSGRTVVIGPVHHKGGIGNVARLHEFGGRKRIKAMNPKDFNRVFRVGERGPITSKHFRGGTDQAIRVTTLRDPLSGKRVVYIRLRTKQQAEHATRLNRRLCRAYAKTKIANYPARPFMGPALEKAAPKLTSFWANAVKA